MYNECYCILLGKILILQYVVISLLLPEMYDMPANEIQLDRVSNAVNSTASTTQKQTPSNMSQLNLQEHNKQKHEYHIFSTNCQKWKSHHKITPTQTTQHISNSISSHYP